MLGDVSSIFHTATSFVAGLTGLDADTVAGGALAGAGALCAIGARLAGWGLRRVAGGLWRGAGWLLTAPPLSAHAQAVLEQLDGPARLIDACGFEAGRVQARADGWGVLLSLCAGGMDLLPHLRSHERKAIARRARQVLEALKVEAEQLHRLAALEALMGPDGGKLAARPPKGGSGTAPAAVIYGALGSMTYNSDGTGR